MCYALAQYIKFKKILDLNDFVNIYFVKVWPIGNLKDNIEVLCMTDTYKSFKKPSVTLIKISPFSYFQIFLPQSPLVMPKGRRQLSREELEIQEVLSRSKGSSRQVSGDTGIVIKTVTGRTPPEIPVSVEVHQPEGGHGNIVPTVDKAQKSNIIALSDFTSIMKDVMVTGIKEGFAYFRPDLSRAPKRKRSVTPVVPRQDDHEIDEDMPEVDEVGMDAVQLEDTASRLEIFGDDVNEYDSEDEYYDEDHDDDHDIDNPVHSYVTVKDSSTSSRNPPQVIIPPNVEQSSSSIPPTDSTDEPDPDLPSLLPRLPSNWHPKSKITNFLKAAANNEWTKDQRQKIIEKYHTNEEFDSYLLPVKMPTKLYKSLKSPAAKKKDYLFNRQEAEKHLYNANYDLCTALRPLIEAISQLSDVPNCGFIKNLLGHTIMGILSANIKISRGRREVSRRFVRLDWAEALYSKAPSNVSLFGGASLDEAVKAAKESSKTDDSLVYIPKKPYRPSYSYFKDFQYPFRSQNRGGKNQGYQQSYQKYNNNNYNYNNTNNKSKGQSQNRGRGRGRGRGGKKPAWSNTKSTNSKE